MIYTTESRRYLEYSMRWRNIPKPSIAAVQGRCIAGGLLLCWPCDLIIASEDAKFSDPVVMMGIGGVEYHGHTWNSGRGRPRRSCSPVGRSRPRRPSRPAWSTRWCRATSSTPRHVHSPSRSRRCRRSVYGRPSARSIRLSTSRLLRGHPVGVRCAPDRPRQCVERRRMAGAHETRRDEAEHQVAHTNAGALPIVEAPVRFSGSGLDVLRVHLHDAHPRNWAVAQGIGHLELFGRGGRVHVVQCLLRVASIS